MFTRVSAVALLLGLVCAVSPSLATDGESDCRESVEFKFNTYVDCELEITPRAILEGPLRGWAAVDVDTNSCTILCVEWTRFTRPERWCFGRQEGENVPAVEGGVIPNGHIDSIRADLDHFRFRERPCAGTTTPGSPMRVTPPRGGTASGIYTSACCWTVETHRGGYEYFFKLTPGSVQCHDDSGCYTARARVTVTAIPGERCENPVELVRPSLPIPTGT